MTPIVSDELYGYDLINRLKDLDRGTLNGGKDGVTDLSFAECWALDQTGNWKNYRQDDDGSGTWDLNQHRSANTVNEITDISESAGPTWVTPVYNRAGNMTTVPQPADPTASYAATYDAWNRLVKLVDGADTVSEYAYDGARRRVIQKSYVSGVLDETRHMYYTEPSKWQVIEERIGSETTADKQFVWGLRYIDDIVLRDDTTQRLYGMQDANWNVTSIVDDVGDVQERFAYSAYGVPVFLNASFTVQSSSPTEWETLYCGYRYETSTGLFHVRNRAYHDQLGVWTQRDKAVRYTERSVSLAMSNISLVHIGFLSSTSGLFNLYSYVLNGPTTLVYPLGEQAIIPFGDVLAAWRERLEIAMALLPYLRWLLSTIPCPCELAVSGIANAVDNLLIPNRPNGTPQWPWQHCTSNCMMVSLCGGGEEAEQCAALLSLAKEILDVIACGLIDHGTGDSCDSAFQPSDFQDNATGRDLGRCCAYLGIMSSSICCAVACSGSYNAPEGPNTPRPFGPLGEGGEWPSLDKLLDDLGITF